MIQVMVRKLDSAPFELEMWPGATLLDLKAAVSMRIDLPSIFIQLVSNRGYCSESTAVVVDSSVGWYQLLVVVTPALDVLKDRDADGDAKLQALIGLVKLGPSVANIDCINTIVKFYADNEDELWLFGLCSKARIAFRAVVEEVESLSIDVGIYSWIFVDGVTFFKDLQTLKRLCRLELNFHQDVDCRDLWCFEKAWCHVAQLTSLKVTLNAAHVGVGWVIAFFRDLLVLKRLCSLELNFYPKLNGFVFCYLGEGLLNLVQLTCVKLCLHDTRVESLDSLLHFIRQLGHLANIRCLHVDFSKNALGDEGARLLGDSIGKLVQLKSLELDLEDNQIGDGGAQCLVDGLRKLTELISLSMFVLKNRIGVVLVEKLRNLEGWVKSRKRRLPS